MPEPHYCGLMESTKTPLTRIDDMSQYTSDVLSVVATTQPRSSAYRRKAGTSVLTSVPYQETSYGSVAMHDGPMEGELIFQLPTYNVVNVHSGVICPIGFSSRHSIIQVTHFLDDLFFVGPANEPISLHFLLSFESLSTSLDQIKSNKVYLYTAYFETIQGCLQCKTIALNEEIKCSVVYKLIPLPA